MMRRSMLCSFPLLLLVAASAHALCGDVTGDGKKSANDALAVLRSAVGQPVELQCINDDPSRLRYYNDFSCGSGSSMSSAEFDGLTFQADGGDLSDYQTVALDSIDNIHVSLCGGDYYFDGPLYLAPGRAITMQMIFADPAVYDFPGVEVPAFFVLYDDGVSASAAANGSVAELAVLSGGAPAASR